MSAPGSTTLTERRLSPEATRMPGALGTLVAQVKAELLSSFRVPEYVVGVIAVPIILYAMFGLPNAGTMLPEGTDVGAVMFASMSAYGVLSLAIFTFGVGVAEERGKGWLRRMRATPMPFWAYFAAKVAAALVFTALILGGTWLLAVVAGGVAFDTSRLLVTVALLFGGTVAFSTLGFSIAYWFRPKAAAAVGNLVFLPLSFLSGFFIPLDQLPDFLGDIAPYLPTHHFGQLVWAASAPQADVAAFGALPGGAVLEHVVWVVGGFLVFGVLAVVGYRRELARAAG
jgi:ABC-2 type transport system permease protein